MIVLGSAIFAAAAGAFPVPWPILYALYGTAGAFWIMVFMCPHCRFHGTRKCPCGYGWISARLRDRKGENRFAEKFRRHIPVIVPLWLIPPAVGGVALWRDFSWPVAVLVAAFTVDSFVVLPLLSKKHCCARCPQRKSCPWMGSGRCDE
jgi:hypothetical protein